MDSSAPPKTNQNRRTAGRKKIAKVLASNTTTTVIAPQQVRRAARTHQTPTWKRKKRKAYTITEVLVALLIMSTIAGLVLTGLQAARESARRAQCMTNLKQIGLAQNMYASIHDMFSPTHLAGKRYWSSSRYSGFVHILPYLDNAPLYASINMSFASTDAPTGANVSNRTAIMTSLYAYLCPSDSNSRALSNYRFNSGVRPTRSPAAGPFALGRPPRPASFLNGLSNTAILSERTGGSFASSASGTQPLRDVKRISWPGESYPGDQQYISYCVSSVNADWHVQSGRYWIFNGMEYTDYNHNGQPNDHRPSCGGSNYGLHPPRSFHSGIVNVLYGDGHVSGVPNTINAQIWLNQGQSNSF